jgi:hypothetical protein
MEKRERYANPQISIGCYQWWAEIGQIVPSVPVCRACCCCFGLVSAFAARASVLTLAHVEKPVSQTVEMVSRTIVMDVAYARNKGTRRMATNEQG